MTDAVRIPLSDGVYALVDFADLEKVSRYRWHTKRKTCQPGKYYAQTTIRLTSGRNGKKTALQLHRYLLDAQPGQVIDHANGDGLDNRRANLRFCTLRENATNVTRSKNQKLGGFKGVAWNKNAGKWEAGISVGEVRANGKRKRVYLGLFINPADAARAYDAAALHHFGAFAAVNFPESRIEQAVVSAHAGDETATLAALSATADALGFTVESA